MLIRKHSKHTYMYIQIRKGNLEWQCLLKKLVKVTLLGHGSVRSSVYSSIIDKTIRLIVCKRFTCPYSSSLIQCFCNMYFLRLVLKLREQGVGLVVAVFVELGLNSLATFCQQYKTDMYICPCMHVTCVSLAIIKTRAIFWSNNIKTAVTWNPQPHQTKISPWANIEIRIITGSHSYVKFVQLQIISHKSRCCCRYSYSTAIV